MCCSIVYCLLYRKCLLSVLFVLIRAKYFWEFIFLIFPGLLRKWKNSRLLIFQRVTVSDGKSYNKPRGECPAVDNNKTHGGRNVDQWRRSIIRFLLILLITLPKVNQVSYYVGPLINHRLSDGPASIVVIINNCPASENLPLMKVPKRVIRLRMAHDGHRHRHFVLHMAVGRPLIAHVGVRDTPMDFLIHILVSDLWLLMRLMTAEVALLVHVARDLFGIFSLITQHLSSNTFRFNFPASKHIKRPR